MIRTFCETVQTWYSLFVSASGLSCTTPFVPFSSVIATRGGGFPSGNTSSPGGSGKAINKSFVSFSIHGSRAPSILAQSYIRRHSAKGRKETTYPRWCWSSASPRSTSCVAPRLKSRLSSNLAAQQNFSYAVSPSPKTANARWSNKSEGKSARRSDCQKAVIERGSRPEPVVDTTKMAVCAENRESYESTM